MIYHFKKQFLYTTHLTNSEALFYAHLVSIICHYMKRVIKFNIYQCYIHVGNKFIDEGIS